MMKYDLVFEGGGAKGMVFVGACEELIRRGHTFGRLLGTSAGAITAGLLAAGYTPEEMLDALVEREGDASVFVSFMGKPPAFTDTEIREGAMLRFLKGVRFRFLTEQSEKKLQLRVAKAFAASERFRHIVALIERGGWFAADRFVAWLCNKLDTGQFRSRPRDFSRATLSQFFEISRVELSLVAADATDGRLLVLNHRTAPDCPLVWAVRMSMSIPLLWDEVTWRVEWGKYLGRDVSGHVVVDGGLLSNFPIELFISDRPHVARLMGPKGSDPVLGMLIDERLPVPQPKGIFVTVDIDPAELKTVQRLRRLIDTATTAHDKMVIDEYGHLVVRLPALGYGTTEFDMTNARRDALLVAGRKAVARYFDAQSDSVLVVNRFTKGEEMWSETTAADRIAVSILYSEGELPNDHASA